MLWQIIVILCILWYLLELWKIRRVVAASRRLESSFISLPVIGHSYMFIGTNEDRMTALKKLSYEAMQYVTNVTPLRLAFEFYTVVVDPEDIDLLSKECLDKPPMLYRFSRKLLGDGSLMAPLNIWRPRRKLMSPMFAQKNLINFVSNFSKQGMALAQSLQSVAGGKAFSVWPFFTTYTMDNVCEPDNDFLEMLLQSPDDIIPSKLLIEEMLVLVLAATDTSAVGASFTAVMLSKHPDVQEKVYEEIRKVIGEKNRLIEASDLANLKYLEAVIKETLRLYPPVPIFVRAVHKDITLPSGVTLVKGSNLLLSVWGAHRHPKYWGEDAEEFKPDRFIKGNFKQTAFIPFSCGPRGCLGYKYAMMSLKTMIASLLMYYEILPAPNLYNRPMRLQYNIMMKDIDNFQIKLRLR
ncbi:cytochrome P450 4g15-like [Zerene cesonia]|uniref:cytochrome P450 4g15-like n=1 Tax=Zerene cesonia TaxID=33412 RepID=UPI0018E58D97|nr:cytochrome P450 4g15-like [Zerene cesonia]